MSWHATQALQEAYDATRAMLLPFSLRKWVILAVVVFFVGWSTGSVGSWNVPTGGVADLPTVPSVSVDTDWVVSDIDLDDVLLPIAAVLLGLVALVAGLAVAVIGSIMQFVFVRQLTDREVRIRGYFGESVSPGLRLFLLWIGLAIALVAIAVAMVILTVITLGLFLVVLIVLLPLLFVAGIGAWVFVRFTFDFVVPIMLVDEVGVIEAWRRLGHEVRAEWQQYGLYAAVRFVLDIAAGLILSFVGVLVFLLFGIPALLIGLALYASTALISSTLAGVLAGVLLLAVIIAAVAVTTIVAGVPVQTYLRYYGLFVLARISPEYDMLGDVRAAIDERTAASSEPDG